MNSLVQNPAVGNGNHLIGDSGPPPAPTGVILTADAADGSVHIVWGAVTGALIYNIYRSTTSGAEANYDTSLVPSYHDAASPPGTRYFYTITVTTTSGVSGPSEEESIFVPIAPPSFTVDELLGDSDTSLFLNTAGSPGATSYNVYRSTTAGTEVLLASGVGMPYNDETNTAGGTFYYKITAVDAGVESPKSAEASGVLKPATPTSFAADVSVMGQVTLSWDSMFGATSYHLIRNTSNTTSGATVIGDFGGSPHTDNTVAMGTQYYYFVQASNASTNSPSQYTSGLAALTIPAAPTISHTFQPGQTTTSWSGVTGATSYKIYRSTVSGSYTTPLASGISSPYVDNTVAAGTIYYYVVRSTNASGDSLISNEVSGITIPSPPTNLAANVATVGQVTLTWTNSTGATSYNVYRSTTSGSYGAAHASGVNSGYVDNSSVADGTQYYYVVSAVDADGESNNSSEVGALTIPAVPTGVAATSNLTTTVSVTWDSMAGAANYEVWRSTSTGAETQLATGQTSPYSDGAVARDGTTYFYKIKSSNASGQSALSAEASGKPVFDVTGLSGLRIWLKADAGVTLNGSSRLTHWVDQSSNAFDFVPVNTPVLNGCITAGPTLNGIATLTFTASAANPALVHNTAGIAGTTNASVYFVWFWRETASAAGGQHDPIIMGSKSSGDTYVSASLTAFTYGYQSDHLYGGTSGTPIFSCAQNSAILPNPGTACIGNAWHTLAVRVGQGGSNGASLTQNIDGGSNIAGGTNLNGAQGVVFYIGAPNSHNTNYIWGDVAEVLFYTNKHSDADATKVINYLKTKYGI